MCKYFLYSLYSSLINRDQLIIQLIILPIFLISPACNSPTKGGGGHNRQASRYYDPHTHTLLLVVAVPSAWSWVYVHQLLFHLSLPVVNTEAGILGHAESVTRAVGEDRVGSPSQSSVNAAASGGGSGGTRSPTLQSEPISTQLRGTPSVPLDGAQIKTEVITMSLTLY